MYRQVNEHGLLFGDSLSPGSPWESTITAHTKDLTTEISRTKDAKANIQADGRYSQSGKDEAIHQLGKQAHATIDKLQRRGPMLSELNAAKIPSRLPTEAELAKKNGLDAIVQHMRLQELRQKLTEIDQLDAAVAINEAATAGNPELVLAASGGHALLQVVPKAMLDQAIQLYLSSQDPPSAKSVREALSLHDSNEATAHKVVRQITGVPQVQRDAIAEMAA